ncbi:MAG: alpha-galactosidase, partial [Boseongicola sp.]|nr:alpha-galactosidase [Boseongicola sp.]
MMQCWRLDDGRQTLVLAARRTRLPEVIYWGAPLPSSENLETLAEAHRLDVTGGMLDENPDLSICPEAVRTFPGQPGLILRSQDGTPLMPKFCYASEEASDQSLALTYADAENGLNYTARIALDPETHVLTLTSEINAATPVHLHWLSAPVLPAPQNSAEMIDVSGRWCGEFQLNKTAWSPGIRYRENRTGRTGHEHFPALIVLGQGATNTQGEAWGFHYGWSGGHRMVAEELPDGRRQIQFGHAARMEPAPQTHFKTAPLYAVYSSDGLNGVAVSYQRQVRDRIVTWPDDTRPRPVHYNCWEAVYFDHKLDVLKDIADRAAKLGAERFVLDDGWFGNRDDDTQSLSDWEVDVRKYPEGLHPLIDHIHGLGLTFGIWFEPEMINPNSNLFRAHPDWAAGSEDQILGRQQMALDMSRADVRD